MTVAPGKVSNRIVSERTSWINTMIQEIGHLPLEDFEIFSADKRNIWAAESCLRRALEALLDLGRHIIAKAFGRGVSEYKEIAQGLKETGVLDSDKSNQLRILAGNRNRMVHFYQEISDKELFEICSSQLIDITNVLEAIRAWLKSHPDIIDETL